MDRGRYESAPHHAIDAQLSRATHAGEYPGRKSGQDVKLINANLDCNENFVKGFGVSEFIVTPAILGLAAVLANINKEE